MKQITINLEKNLAKLVSETVHQVFLSIFFFFFFFFDYFVYYHHLQKYVLQLEHHIQLLVHG